MAPAAKLRASPSQDPPEARLSRRANATPENASDNPTHCKGRSRSCFSQIGSSNATQKGAV